MSEENLNREPEEEAREAEPSETLSEQEPHAAESAVTPPEQEPNAVEPSVTPPEQEPFEEESAEAPPEKEPKKISLFTCVCSAIALIVATALITGCFCFFGYRKKLAEIAENSAPNGQLPDNVATAMTPFSLITQIFEHYGMADLDQEEMILSALKSYVYATGDPYAAYYTEEEAALLAASNSGSSEGIGINITEDELVIDGAYFKVLRVVNVMENSPALEAGIRIGDMIWGIGSGEDLVTVSHLGHDLALTQLQGTAGTEAVFSVFRPLENGLESLDFRIKRAAITTTSVRGHMLTVEGRRIGVMKIFRFDATTPTQFKIEMNRLIGEGCEAFVYDVRNNPGGALVSVETVLSYFLKKGDTIVITRDSLGNEEISRVGAATYTGTYASCSITEEEIGMYASYPAVVLCNDGTASAGELFTAVFRDYNLAPTVGVTTYGKGTVQQYFDLAMLGYEGVLKLTVEAYYPPCDQGYDGIGIAPDYVVEPSEEMWSLNSFEVNIEKDNQLASAVSHLLGNS